MKNALTKKLLSKRKKSYFYSKQIGIKNNINETFKLINLFNIKFIANFDFFFINFSMAQLNINNYKKKYEENTVSYRNLDYFTCHFEKNVGLFAYMSTLILVSQSPTSHLVIINRLKICLTDYTARQ